MTDSCDSTLPVVECNHLPMSLFRHEKILQDTLTSNSIDEVCLDRSRMNRRSHTFNTKVSIQAKPTNQKSSGRCWLFAALNQARTGFIKKHNLKNDFEFSQSHLFFWDKYERANFFLTQYAALMKEKSELDPVTPATMRFATVVDALGDEAPMSREEHPFYRIAWLERTLDEMIDQPISDGGQWDMLVNLINKYGLVPKDVYRETVSSSSSSKLNWLLNHHLRTAAGEIRENKGVLTDERRLELLDAVYRILELTLGTPPNPDDAFIWEYQDAKNEYHKMVMTPKQFYEREVPFCFGDWVSVVHDPRNPYFQTYSVPQLGNVVEGNPVLYYNVPMKLMKQLCVEQIKKDQPVWFGCDMGPYRERESCQMDFDLFTYDEVFKVRYCRDKAERLRNRESKMTHAMLLTAVHLENNPRTGASLSLDETQLPTRWRVENSWGSRGEESGYYTMQDSWFNEFVFEVAVPRSRLDDLFTAESVKKPTNLPLWDPLGALAQN